METQKNSSSQADDSRPTADDGVSGLSMRLNEGQANSIYSTATQLFNCGRYEQASSLYALLGMYLPEDARYANAVGACYKKMGRHEHALRLFARAMELRPNDYGPAFQLIECLLLLGRRSEAFDLVRDIIAVARVDGDMSTLYRADGILDLLLAPLQ